MLRFLRRGGVAVGVLAVALALAGTTGCRKKTPEDRLKEAEQLFEERQVPLAVLKLKDMIAEMPEDPATLQARAMLIGIYMQLGRPENLQSAMEQAEAILKERGIEDEQGLQTHQLITELLLRLRKHEEALAHSQKGIDSVKNPEAKERMELIHGTLLLTSPKDEDKKKGEEYFEKVMMEAEKKELRGQAREVLASYHRDNKRYAESNAAYERYLAKFPEDSIRPQLEMAMGMNLRAAGDEAAGKAKFAEGAAAYAKQIDEELDANKRTPMLMDFARMHEIMGDYAKAEELLRRVMAERPRTREAIDAQGAIGQIYISANELDRAAKHFEQMKAENPNSPIARSADQMLAAIVQMKAAAKASDTGTTGTATQQPPAQPSPAAPQ